jgi:hypothetical protein
MSKVQLFSEKWFQRALRITVLAFASNVELV